MKALAAFVAVILLAGAWHPGAVAPGTAVGQATPTTSPGPNGPTIRIGVLRNGAYEVVALPLEEYVARVLTGEALPASPPAAMDALAIAIRTYTQTNLGRHRAEGFDLCDQTHCQVMRASTPTSDRAAKATANQILTYRSAPATIYYSASCGGRTEIPSAVWPGADDPPYLPSQPDDGCEGGPLWTAELALSDLRRSFAAAGHTGTLREMRITGRDRSGRVAKLALDGLTPSEISGQDLRAIVGRTLGWQYVRSAAFEMRRSGDIYRLDGRGSGHGVGMCVIGSAKLAEGGRTAMAILTHYYPGVQIGAFTPQPQSSTRTAVPAGRGAPAATPPVVVAAPTRTEPLASVAPATAAASSAAKPAAAAAPTAAVLDGVAFTLPVENQGDRASLSAFVARERDSLAKVLGVAAPTPVVVRAYDTVAEYQKATGRPWFTSGAVISGTIHLPPIGPLRERGVLDRTVREQLVHLLVDDVLRQRPTWVRDGAAQFYADSATASGSAFSRAECPSNADLENPVSPGALNNAYAQARACFERQVTGGRSWRDVR